MKDSTWLLTRYILEHASDHQWKRNSNCIVLNLVGTAGIGVALSIFDSRYRHRDGEIIHSHHSDFKSRIVAGVMHQQRYVPADKETGVLCACRSFDVDYKPILTAPLEDWFRELPEEHYFASEQYSILAPELHRTWPEDGTVTFRVTEYKSQRSGVRVVWRPGELPQQAVEGAKTEIKIAPDEVPSKMLSDIVANSLHRWF